MYDDGDSSAVSGGLCLWGQVYAQVPGDGLGHGVGVQLTHTTAWPALIFHSF